LLMMQCYTFQMDKWCIQQSLQLLQCRNSQQRKLNNPWLQSCVYPR
jgi:hypothetical protein